MQFCLCVMRYIKNVSLLLLLLLSYWEKNFIPQQGTQVFHSVPRFFYILLIESAAFFLGHTLYSMLYSIYLLSFRCAWRSYVSPTWRCCLLRRSRDHRGRFGSVRARIRSRDPSRAARCRTSSSRGPRRHSEPPPWRPTREQHLKKEKKYECLN